MQPIGVSHAPSLARARVAGPRFLLDALTSAGARIEAIGKIPSLAHRLCKVADGSLDVALASADSNDWDIAAAHLIVERAGGKLADLDGVVPSVQPRFAPIMAASSRLPSTGSTVCFRR